VFYSGKIIYKFHANLVVTRHDVSFKGNEKILLMMCENSKINGILRGKYYFTEIHFMVEHQKRVVLVGVKLANFIYCVRSPRALYFLDKGVAIS
jgi:hypothetical protein